MSEATATLRRWGDRWRLLSGDWSRVLRRPNGEVVRHGDAGGVWFFRFRGEAIQFAARREIRIEEQS